MFTCDNNYISLHLYIYFLILLIIIIFPLYGTIKLSSPLISTWFISIIKRKKDLCKICYEYSYEVFLICSELTKVNDTFILSHFQKCVGIVGGVERCEEKLIGRDLSGSNRDLSGSNREEKSTSPTSKGVNNRWVASLRKRDPEIQPTLPAINRNRLTN